MEKSDEVKVAEIITSLQEKEKAYNKMPKKTLVDLLVVRDMLDESFEPEGKEMNLWYYVSDWTGVKYLSNEQPKKHIVFNKVIYMSDGEVNIRVPKCMEPLFPEMKYEDEPAKVRIATSY